MSRPQEIDVNTRDCLVEQGKLHAETPAEVQEGPFQGAANAALESERLSQRRCARQADRFLREPGYVFVAHEPEGMRLADRPLEFGL